MRVRLRGFDDFELRRRPLASEHVTGEVVQLGARTVARLLRFALTELPPHTLRSLVLDADHRVELDDDQQLLDRIAELIHRGDLVLVRLPKIVVEPGEPAEEIEYEPSEPEGIVEQTDWIEIFVQDEDDEPVRGVAYELVLPDGSKQRGRTNQEGVARVEHIPSGNCELTLVELDAQAWEYPA